MPEPDPLDVASDLAFSRLDAAHRNVSRLPKPLQTFIRVLTAQAIIDNGGLQFFFETDFEDRPPYSDFVSAYEEIGASDASDALARAVKWFRFLDPHLDCDKRQEVLKDLWDDPYSDFWELDSQLCGDERVWSQLRKFILDHPSHFTRADH